MTRRARCAVLRRTNQSGVSGVTRSVVRDRRSQAVGPTVYWVARWPGDHGTATQRRFSVKRFGEWGAFLKAVEARRHGLACLNDSPERLISPLRLPGRTVPHEVCEIKVPNTLRTTQ